MAAPVDVPVDSAIPSVLAGIPSVSNFMNGQKDKMCAFVEDKEMLANIPTGFDLSVISTSCETNQEWDTSKPLLIGFTQSAQRQVLSVHPFL